MCAVQKQTSHDVPTGLFRKVPSNLKQRPSHGVKYVSKHATRPQAGLGRNKATIMIAATNFSDFSKKPHNR